VSKSTSKSYHELYVDSGNDCELKLVIVYNCCPLGPVHPDGITAGAKPSKPIVCSGVCCNAVDVVGGLEVKWAQHIQSVAEGPDRWPET